MSKLVVVDVHSGFIWGVSHTTDPIVACRDVNENEAKQFGLTYEDIGGACFNGRSGFEVYRAPDDFEVTDGQNQEQIERVLDLTSVGRIVTSRPDEDE